MTTDLNSWRMVTSDQTLAFGTQDTGYPFYTQFSLGKTDRDTQDAGHPTSDGLVMGRDRLRGFTIQFDCRILAEYPVVEKPWLSAMDLYSTFAAKWRADSVRRSPGEYATLINDDRGRQTYGRPRDIAPKSDMLRKGIYDFQMDFASNGPNWYAATQKVAVLQSGPASIGKITSPLTSPLTTIRPKDATIPTLVEGDLEAEPIVEFHGPTNGCSIELFSGATKVWTLKVPGKLHLGETLKVDTRFWRRSAILNKNTPGNGLIRGDSLAKCLLPVGVFTARYRHNDPTGAAFAVIRWRDTYAGP